MKFEWKGSTSNFPRILLDVTALAIPVNSTRSGLLILTDSILDFVSGGSVVSLIG